MLETSTSQQKIISNMSEGPFTEVHREAFRKVDVSSPQIQGPVTDNWPAPRLRELQAPGATDKLQTQEAPLPH